MPFLRHAGDGSTPLLTFLRSPHTFSTPRPSSLTRRPKDRPTPRHVPPAWSPKWRRAGVLGCAGRIDQVSQFIGADAVGAYFFAPPAQPDQRMVSFSYEIQPQAADAPLAYASASFAPNQANGCGAMYEAIVYWLQKCDVVAVKQFAQFRKGRSLQTNILVLESETAARVFLMPAGKGCLSIKKKLSCNFY